MKYLLALTSALLLFSASGSQAAYQSGVDAYQQGNIAQAIERWEDTDDARSRFALGMLYEGGDGVTKDLDRAYRYYRRAASEGLVEAQLRLARLILVDTWSDKGPAEAAEWLQQASDSGNPDAAFQLALMSLEGWNESPPDMEEAVRLFRAAANEGHVQAQNNLGSMYENGEGVAQDYQQARQWYEKAAAEGESYAVNNLGALYAKGLGVEQDLATAIEMFIESAGKGNALARRNLDALIDALPATRVTSSSANVRSGPGTRNQRIASLERSHPLTVIRTRDDWHQIFFNEGGSSRVGWVAASLTGQPDRNAGREKPSTTVSAQQPSSSRERSGAASGGWGIQVGVFGNESNARKLQQRLQRAGHQSFIVERDDGLNAVTAGPYASRGVMSEQRNEIREDIGIKGIPVSLD